MTAPLESSIVRFRKSNGAVVGAGFLVSKKHILTCAHVVADALGIARDTQDIPTEDVYLDFPLVDSETQLTARVVFWRPVPPKGSTSVKGKEDIAGLELNSPLAEGVQPVDLIIEEDLRGHSFRTFGFPSGHDDGLEATGVLRGRQGTGWVQLEGVTQTGVRLEPGFSGAPVWDETQNGVVGMAVAADQKRPEAKVAFMIPTKVLVIAWPDLGELTILSKPFRRWHKTFGRWTSVALIPVLGVTIFSIPQVQKGLKIGQPSCFDIAHQQGKLVVVLPNFANNKRQQDNDTSFEDDVRDKLEDKIQEYAVVCRLNKVVKNSDQAKEIGNSNSIHGASIVIWANLSTVAFRGGIVVVDWQQIRYPFAEDLAKIHSNYYNFEIKTFPELVSVLTHLTLSEIQYSRGQVPEARKTLSILLDATNSQELAEQNPEEWAKAYYFQGFLLEDPTNPDYHNAKKAYENALRLNPDLYAAQLGLGQVYERLGQLSQAEQIYEQLGKCKERSTASFALVQLAFLYHQKGERTAAETAFEEAIRNNRLKGLLARASAHLNWWNDASGAVRDLKMAIKESPKDPMIYGLLGQAQLEAGKREEARKTYQDVLCYLDEEERTSLIENLEFLAEEKLAPKEDVTAIIDQLKAAHLRQNQAC
jgi:tetratricopeptide (TPR) repeat protein/S1-C subfamily serine protease